MDAYLSELMRYLVAQSWQIAVLTMVVAVMTFTLRRRSAHVRYLLWLIVLAKCLVPPLYMVPVRVLPETVPERVPPILSGAVWADEHFSFPSLAADTVRHEPRGREPRESVLVPPVPEISEPRLSISGWLGVFWIVGAGGYLMMNLLRALRGSRWLRRTRRPPADDVQADLADLLPAYGIKRLPRIWIVEGVGQPFVWGLLRGSIYVPPDFFAIESPQHRRDVLAHELSHVLRFDPAVNTLQVIVQGLFWFHPFVWWVNRKIRQEREKACDEMAVARLGAKPKEYSTALVTTLIQAQESTRPVPSLAVAGPVKNIEERIRAMLRPGKRFHKRPSLIAVTTVFLAAVLTVPTALVLTARAQTGDAEQMGNRATGGADPDPPTEPLGWKLIEAAETGDIKRLKSLIDRGVDVNAYHGARGTALTYAVLQGQLEAVRVLITHGADVNSAIGFGATPLIAAAFAGQAQIAELLLKNGAEVDGDKGYSTPLFEAVGADHGETVKVLIVHHANVNRAVDGGISGLVYVVLADSEETVNVLMARQAEIDRTLETLDGGITPLFIAIWSQQAEIVKALIEAGATIDVKDSHGWTPLHWAVAGGAREMARMLLEAGAEISGIHRAVVKGDLKSVRGFIESGTDVDTFDGVGLPLSYWALSAEQIEVFDYLLRHGADVTITMADRHGNTHRQGYTLLHKASEKGLPEVVTRLLAEGADVNAKTDTGATPLFEAANRGHEEVCRLLIGAGADVNTALNNGRHPLGDATMNGHEGIVKLLLAAGADVDLSVNNRGSALTAAAQEGWLALVELLIAHGADVNAEYRRGTPLHSAVEVIRRRTTNETVAQVVKKLVDHSADVNAVDRSGRTPLHTVAQRGLAEAAEVLIAGGADINAKDDQGRTPLSYAAGLYESRGVAEVLRRHGAKE